MLFSFYRYFCNNYYNVSALIFLHFLKSMTSRTIKQIVVKVKIPIRVDKLQEK